MLLGIPSFFWCVFVCISKTDSKNHKSYLSVSLWREEYDFFFDNTDFRQHNYICVRDFPIYLQILWSLMLRPLI